MRCQLSSKMDNSWRNDKWQILTHTHICKYITNIVEKYFKYIRSIFNLYFPWLFETKIDLENAFMCPLVENKWFYKKTIKNMNSYWWHWHFLILKRFIIQKITIKTTSCNFPSIDLIHSILIIKYPPSSFYFSTNVNIKKNSLFISTPI